MKTSKRTLCIALALLLILSTTVPALASQAALSGSAVQAASPAAADAAETVADAEADSGEASDKEEIIYVTLDASGSVVSAYVVNSFPGGEITDYGDYTSVRVLNTEDEIEYANGVATLTSDASRVYYQGTLESPALPWNIALEYSLDGKRVTPEEIAGQSGEVEIRFTVTRNSDCEGSFYDDYALQANFTLSGSVFSNISAPDATVAAVGADRQLTYTLLPGEGIDTAITATAHEFALPAVSINGIHLNLNVDIDTQDIKDQVSRLVDATGQLNSGASALYTGSEALRDGAAGLLDGSESLQSGIAELDAGVAELQSGLVVMRDGLNELYANSGALVSGAGQIYAGLAEIDAQLSALDSLINVEQLMQVINDIKNIVSGLESAYADAQSLQNMIQGSVSASTYSNAGSALGSEISELEGILSQIELTDEQKAALAASIANIKTSAELILSNPPDLSGLLPYVQELLTKLNTLIEQLTGSGQTLGDYIDQLANMLTVALGKLEELREGISQLTDGSAELYSGIGEYTGGVAQLVDGFGSVMNGVSALAEGSSALLSGSDELGSGVSALYDGVAALCSGAQSMASGASALDTETSRLDVQAEIDSLLAGIGGSMDSPESFVDARNGTISVVQFVIQTEAIEAPAEAAEPEPAAEEQTFWQKFLALFGL